MSGDLVHGNGPRGGHGFVVVAHGHRTAVVPRVLHQFALRGQVRQAGASGIKKNN